MGIIRYCKWKKSVNISPTLVVGLIDKNTGLQFIVVLKIRGISILSADNGIYILHTIKDGQYRVKELQAIENLYWNAKEQREETSPQANQVLKMFGNTKYTRNRELAYNIANSMKNKAMILEYGIEEITINCSWDNLLSS